MVEKLSRVNIAEWAGISMSELVRREQEHVQFLVFVFEGVTCLLECHSVPKSVESFLKLRPQEQDNFVKSLIANLDTLGQTIAFSGNPGAPTSVFITSVRRLGYDYAFQLTR